MARTAVLRYPMTVIPQPIEVHYPSAPLRPFNLPLPVETTTEIVPRELPEPPQGTGYAYGRLDGEWVPVVRLAGDQLTGRLFLYQDPVVDHESATKHYADTNGGSDGGEY